MKYPHMVRLVKLLAKLQPGPHHLCVPHGSADPETKRAIKLVRSDGSVQIFHRTVRVSDLMQQFPKHMVCPSGSFYIGQKVPFLSETDKLKLGHDYFLLPNHFFQSVLSFVTITALSQEHLSKNDAVKHISGKSSSCQPFHIHKGPSGCLRIRVTDEFMSQIMMARAGKLTAGEGVPPESKVCTTARLRKDYEQLVGVRRRWKPKLGTIKETETEKLRRRVSSPFARVRRKKKTKSGDQIKAAQNSGKRSGALDGGRTKPPAKPKIKFKSRKFKIIKKFTRT